MKPISTPARGRSCVALFSLLFATLNLASPLFAQSATTSVPERLPPETALYISWQGTASLSKAAAQNHLLQLLADPDLSPVWLNLMNQLRAAQERKGPASRLDLAAVLSLLENPAVFGLETLPPPGSSDPPPRSTPRVGWFLIYDETGKAPLIHILKQQLESSEQQSAPSSYDFGGAHIEVRQNNANPTYSAEAAGYYFFANRKRVIEDLITRFQAKPATSLAQLPDFQTASQYLGPRNAISFYCRTAPLIALTPSGKKSTPLVQIIAGLHLDKVHALAEGVSFSGEATRFRGAVLGDASPGGPFDIIGASGATFATQPAIGTAPQFTISRVDFAALYRLIRAALGQALTPDRQASITAMEGMAQNYLGMSIGDALALFSGEFANVTTYSQDGSPQSLFAISIHQPDDVLRVLRAALATLIASEDTSGGVTYLDLAHPYKDPATKTTRQSFYYVGVTPQNVLVAPHKDMLRAAQERLADPPGAVNGIFADPQYIQLRGQLPEKLSGLSAQEIAQVPWDKIMARMADAIEHAGKRSQSGSPSLDWLRSLPPDLISRHLHITVGGWWKDSAGVYSDAYLQ